MMGLVEVLGLGERVREEKVRCFREKVFWFGIVIGIRRGWGKSLLIKVNLLVMCRRVKDRGERRVGEG